MRGRDTLLLSGLLLCVITLVTEPALGQSGKDSPYDGKATNLQVLEANDQVEVLDQMFHQTKALGVKCTYCHNEENFASDSLPAKEVARSMMIMVRDINATYLATLTTPVEVTCFTCHRGALKPENDPKKTRK